MLRREPCPVGSSQPVDGVASAGIGLVQPSARCRRKMPELEMLRLISRIERNLP
jgi:hypothetical protein